MSARAASAASRGGASTSSAAAAAAAAAAAFRSALQGGDAEEELRQARVHAYAAAQTAADSGGHQAATMAPHLEVRAVARLSRVSESLV
jgi:hypothetical protein